MDKLTIISGALFLAADIFAVASLAMPDWIVTEVIKSLQKKWYALKFSGRRRHQTGADADLPDLTQATLHLLHPLPQARVVDHPDLRLLWLHLCDHHRGPHPHLYLGQDSHSICQVGWLCSR